MTEQQKLTPYGSEYDATYGCPNCGHEDLLDDHFYEYFTDSDGHFDYNLSEEVDDVRCTKCGCVYEAWAEITVDTEYDYADAIFTRIPRED